VVCGTALSPDSVSVHLALSGRLTMAVSIGNARVCKRSCLARFSCLPYSPRVYIVRVRSWGRKEVVVIVSVGPCLPLLCHSHVLTPYIHCHHHKSSSHPQTLTVPSSLENIHQSHRYASVSHNIINPRTSASATNHPACNTPPPSSWPSPAWPLPNPPAPQHLAQQPLPLLAPTNPAAAKPLTRKKTLPANTSLPTDHTDNSLKHHHKLPRIHRPPGHQLPLQRLGLPMHELTSRANVLRQLPVR
jgi:hypothetical protein